MTAFSAAKLDCLSFFILCQGHFLVIVIFQQDLNSCLLHTHLPHITEEKFVRLKNSTGFILSDPLSEHSIWVNHIVLTHEST